MTVASIVPNVDIYPGAVVGAASGWQALTDGNDATYAAVQATPTSKFGLSTFTIPAGGVVKSATVSMRGYTIDPSHLGDTRPLTLFAQLRNAGGSTLTNYTFGLPAASTAPSPPVYARTGTPAAIAVDQATLDGLQMWWTSNATELFPGATPPQGALCETAVSVTYATIPVVVVSAPTGTILSASPPATWTFTGDADADFAGTQQRYQVKVFTAAQYGAAGFDPATAVPVYDSGVVVSDVKTVPVGPLPNLATLKAYVRAAQSVNGVAHWSVWTAGPEFTTNTDPPVVATIVAASSSGTALGRSTGATQHAYLDPTNGYVLYTADPTPRLACDITFLSHLRLTDEVMHTGTAAYANQAGAWGAQIYTGYPIVGLTPDGGGGAVEYYPLDASQFRAAFAPDTDFYLGHAVALKGGPHATATKALMSTDGTTWTEFGTPPGFAGDVPPMAAVKDVPDNLYIPTSGMPGCRIYSVEMRTGFGVGPRYLASQAGYVTTPNTADMAITGPVRLTIHQAIDAIAPAAFPGSIAKNGATRELYMYAYEPNSWLATFETNGADDTTTVGVALANGTPDGTPFTCGIEFAPGSTAATIIGTDGVRSPYTFPQAAKPTNISAPLRLGDSGATGRIYWAQLERLDAAGNPAGIIWRFDAEDAPTDATTTTWTDPRGRTWTVSDPTAISGRTLWRFDADEYPGTGTTWTDPRGRVWSVTSKETIVADGAVKITVTRDTGHTDWTHVNVERSAGDRFSWEPVRGALELAAPDDVVIAHDYEQPEGVNLSYRARGIIKSGDTVVSQGAWLATATPIVWTPSECGEYLRDPSDPFGAVLIEVLVDDATTTTEHRVGLIDVIGRASPVTVWDVPSLAAGTLPIVTRTYADGTALYDLVRTAPVLLWQGRRSWGHPHRWLVVTNHTVSRYPSSDPSWAEYREWALDYVEVDPPPVLS